MVLGSSPSFCRTHLPRVKSRLAEERAKSPAANERTPFATGGVLRGRVGELRRRGSTPQPQ